MALKENNNLIDALSIALVTAICTILVFYISPKNEKWLFVMIIFCINCIVGFVAKKLWTESSIKKYTIIDWIKATVFSTLIVAALCICDIVIGLVAYPDLVFYEAAQKNIGFVVTLFISPIILITLVGTLRACLLCIFTDNNKSDAR